MYVDAENWTVTNVIKRATPLGFVEAWPKSQTKELVLVEIATAINVEKLATSRDCHWVAS